MVEKSNGKDPPPWPQLPKFTVLDCESLPDDVVIHRDDVFMTQEESATGTWDLIADVISPNNLDNPVLSKKAQITINKNSISVNLVKMVDDDPKHHKFHPNSTCYHVQANKLTGFFLILDNKDTRMDYSYDGTSVKTESVDASTTIQAVYANLFPHPHLLLSCAWRTFNSVL
jgi:hypothetical protein